MINFKIEDPSYGRQIHCNHCNQYFRILIVIVLLFSNCTMAIATVRLLEFMILNRDMK